MRGFDKSLAFVHMRRLFFDGLKGRYSCLLAGADGVFLRLEHEARFF